MGLQDKGDEHPTYAPEGVQDCQVLFLNYKISTCSYVPVHDLLSQLFKCGYKEMSSWTSCSSLTSEWYFIG